MGLLIMFAGIGYFFGLTGVIVAIVLLFMIAANQ